MKRQEHPLYSDLSSTERDKIIKLCTTYGLNEEQTKQLVADLKNGGAMYQAQSTNELSNPIDKKLASIISAKNQELSFNDSQFKFQSEYSFKPAFTSNQQGITSQQQSFEKALIEKMRDEEEKFEQLIGQNQMLKRQKEELQNKVHVLLQRKSQQSQIIVGLKNAVCTLTSLLKDKQEAYLNLHQNYQKLVNGLYQKQNRCSQQKSLSQKPQRDSFRKHDQARSSRENILKQVQVSNNFQRKQSRDFSKTKSSQNIVQKSQNSRLPLKWNEDSRQSKQINTIKKQNKLDMSKYKVFIDELKNICSHKPHRV